METCNPFDICDLRGHLQILREELGILFDTCATLWRAFGRHIPHLPGRETQSTLYMPLGPIEYDYEPKAIHSWTLLRTWR